MIIRRGFPEVFSKRITYEKNNPSLTDHTVYKLYQLLRQWSVDKFLLFHSFWIPIQSLSDLINKTWLTTYYYIRWKKKTPAKKSCGWAVPEFLVSFILEIQKWCCKYIIRIVLFHNLSIFWNYKSVPVQLCMLCISL